MSKRHRLNVIGSFYVEDGCCTMCGVPEHLAPALFASDGGEHCFVQRQPTDADEVDVMLRVMVSQELACVRYAGSDEALLRRLAENDEAALCDRAPPRDAVPLRRDHVVFVARGAWTARRLLERFVAVETSWRATRVVEDGTTASVSVAWSGDDHHRIDASPAAAAGEWLIRHHGPPRLGDAIHDWMIRDGRFEQIRWQTADASESRPTPW